jgi:hypothetical protein
VQERSQVLPILSKDVILDFKTMINYKRLGWTYYSVYVRFQNITEAKRKEMTAYMKAHPLAGQVLQCEGRWQFVYGFFAKDVFQLSQDLRNFYDSPKHNKHLSPSSLYVMYHDKQVTLYKVPSKHPKKITTRNKGTARSKQKG